MKAFFKIVSLASLYISSHAAFPLKASHAFDDLPENVMQSIFKSFSHREIVFSMGRLNKKFHNLSLKDWSWEKTDIQTKNGIKPKEMELFLNAVSTNPSLPVRELTIANLTFDSSQLQKLAQWMFSDQNKSLKCVSFHGCNLASNKISEEDYREFTTNFGNWLKNTRTLTALDFTKSSVSYTLLEQISGSLQSNTSLREVILDEIFNGPFPGSLPRNIYINLKPNTTLEHFSFKNNRVTTSIDDRPLELLEQISQLRPDSLTCVYEGTNTLFIP